MNGDILIIKQKFYQIKGPIGQGGAGNVFLAENQNNEKFAIKRIERYNNPIVKQSTDQEIKLQKIFKNNDHIIQCLGEQVIDGVMYIVFELGQSSLRNRIQIQCLTQKDYISMLVDVANGLLTIHTKNIIHRDIKPQNIIQKQGIYKITDFGISIQKETDDSVVGTILYWAPQILFQNQEMFTQKIDVWSFGVVAFQAFFGINPFYYDSNMLSMRKAQQIIKKNIKKLTPNFTLQKLIKHLSEQGLKQKSQYIQQKSSQKIPQLMQIFGSFFDPNPQTRPEIEFFVMIFRSIYESYYGNLSGSSLKKQPKKCRLKVQSIKQLFDINFFVKTLNLFYQLNFELCFKNSKNVELALQVGLWYIEQATYRSQFVLLNNQQKIEKLKQNYQSVWIQIVRPTLFEYYHYLRQQKNNFFQKISLLKISIILCSIWNKIIFKKDFHLLMTKLTDIKIASLEQFISYLEIFTQQQLIKIQQFILASIYD